MKNIVSLNTLYKRDTAGRIREWTVEHGFDDDDNAGTRTVSGLTDGKKVTSVWNITEAKNVGKVNATNAREQAVSEAQSLWDINAEKEYFEKYKDSIHRLKSKAFYEKYETTNCDINDNISTFVLNGSGSELESDEDQDLKKESSEDKTICLID